MRPRLVHLLCWSALLLAAPGVTRGQISEEMRSRIRAALPKYSPPAPETKPAASPVGTPAPLTDDTVVKLPLFEIVQRRGPVNNPDAWLDKKALKEKAYKEYKNSLTPLEWALNCFSIFLLTPSVQARADAAHEEKKFSDEMNDLSNVVNALSRIDPEEARKLSQDLDLSRHPGN